MENAAEILVIILSVFLAIFLILGITLTIILIKLTNSIRRVAEKAEHVVDNVESAATAFKGAAGSFAVGKFLVNIADTVLKHKKRKD